MSNEKRIKEIGKEFSKLGRIQAVPTIMIASALLAKFTKVEPIFEFLKNDSIVNAMLVVATPIVLWCTIKAIRLEMERKRIVANANS